MRMTAQAFTRGDSRAPAVRPDASPGGCSLNSFSSAARRGCGGFPRACPFRNAVPGWLALLALVLPLGEPAAGQASTPPRVAPAAAAGVPPAPPAGSGEANPDESLRLELEEARDAVRLLADRNERLLKEKLDLQAQVASVSSSLALLQAELDRQLAQRDADGVGPPLPVGLEDGRTLFDARVADASKDLRMIILDVGRLQGVRHGTAFSVVRGGIQAARVRVLDVRDAVSGAVIEEVFAGGPPQKGDRLVLWNEKESP